MPKFSAYMKGEGTKGDTGGFGIVSATAHISDIPSATVQVTGPNDKKNFNFEFGLVTGEAAGFSTNQRASITTTVVGTQPTIEVSVDPSSPNTEKSFNFDFTIPEPKSIERLEQSVLSTTSEGENQVIVYYNDGTTTSFSFYNGEQGEPAFVEGVTTEAALLPQEGNHTGKAYIVGTEGSRNLYVYINGQWQNQGSISGAGFGQPNAIAEAIPFSDMATTTGSIVTLEKTKNNFLEINNVNIDIEPIQDLHGYDHPWPAGGGKNLFDYRTFNSSISGLTVTLSSNGIFTISGIPTTDYIKIVERININDLLEDGQTYTLSATDYNNNGRCYLQVRYVKISDNSAVYQSTNLGAKTFTVDKSTYKDYSICIQADTMSRWGSESYTYTAGFQLEKGSSATSFVPYSNVCPISGHSTVTVTRTGINIWDEEWELGGYSTINGGKDQQTNKIRSKNYISVKPNTSYYFIRPNGIAGNILEYAVDKTYIGVKSSPNSFTTSASTYYVTFYFGSTYGTTYNNDISINYPSTDTQYHAYQGTAVTIDLDGTRYGGTLNVETGVMRVTKACVDMGTLSWTRRLANDKYRFEANMPNGYVRPTSVYERENVICSIFKGHSSPISGSGVDNTISFYENTDTVYINANQWTTAESFVTAMSGQQLLYPITPFTVQLTPIEINNLKEGFWADIDRYEDNIPENISRLKVDLEPIQNLHGYDNPWPTGGGKNKLKPPAVGSTTINNVTFTVNNDGTIKVNGTASANTDFYYVGANGVYADAEIPTGSYKANGNPLSNSIACFYVVENGGSTKSIYGGYDTSVDIDSSKTYRIMLRIMSGQTVTNQVFKPMIRLSSDTDSTYAPYSNVCPISGHDNATITIMGINIWDEETELGGFDVDGSANSRTDTIKSKNYIPCVPDTTYYFKQANLGSSAWSYFVFYDASKNIINGRNTCYTTVTTPSNARYLKFQLNSSYGTTYNNDVSLNYPSTATTYAPHQGTSVTINFDDTCYGGTLDMVAGMLMVTHGIVDLGTLSWTKWNTTTGNWRFVGTFGDNLAPKHSANTTTVPNIICSNYPAITPSRSWQGDVGITIDQTNNETMVVDFNYSDASTFKNALSGVQLAYELATPITVQLTPAQLLTILGENNYWTNTGNIELIYSKVADPIVTVSTDPNSPEIAKIFNFDFKIPQGPKGDQGIQGPMPNVQTTASVTTVPVNSLPTVSTSTINNNIHFDFGIPEGSIPQMEATVSTSTLEPEENANVSVTVNENILHFDFDIPKGQIGPAGIGFYQNIPFTSTDSTLWKYNNDTTYTLIVDRTFNEIIPVGIYNSNNNNIAATFTLATSTQEHEYGTIEYNTEEKFDGILYYIGKAPTPQILVGSVTTAEEPNVVINNINNNAVIDFTLPNKGISSTTNWGNIEGTLTNQTDLQNTLNNKADAILENASGSIVHITDGSPHPVESLIVDVDPVQDLHGYDNPWPAGNGKNLLPKGTSSTHYSGITFTVQDNGEVVATGTASALAFWGVQFTLPAGTYILNGCPAGGGTSNYQIDIRNAVGGTGISGIGGDIGSGVTFTISEPLTAYVNIRIANGYACPSGGLKLSPMIRLSSVTDATFTPYSNVCSISGHTSAVVTRAGKNLLKNEFEDYDKYGIAITKNADGTLTANGQPDRLITVPVNESVILKPGEYTLMCCPPGGNYDTGYFAQLQRIKGNVWYSDSGSGITFTVTEEEEFLVRIGFRANTSVNNIVYKPMIRLYSNSDATYEPYNGTSITIDLNGTRYGGSLNVTTGVLMVDRAMVDLGTLSWGLNNQGFMVTSNIADRIKYPSASNILVENALCSALKVVKAYDIYYGTYGIGVHSNGEVRVRYANMSTNPVTFKSDVTGWTFVYPLAEPFTAQLDPETLSLLRGVNNVWADTGDMEVGYRADTKLYIDNKIAQAIAEL